MLDEELPGVPYTLSHQLDPDRARIPPRLDHRDRRLAEAADAAAPAARWRTICAPRGFAGELLIGTSVGGCQHVAELSQPPDPHAEIRPRHGAGRRAAPTRRSRSSAATPSSATPAAPPSTSASCATATSSTRATAGSGRRWLGHMVACPRSTCASIGAGGGSIAWIDAGGLLRVGPQSAGAVPGPACYGARRRPADRDRRRRRARLFRSRLLQRRAA